MKKIIKFGAPWCSACSGLDRLKLEKLSLAETIDISIDEEAVIRYNITKLPTVIELTDDVETLRLVGAGDIADYYVAV